MASREISVNLDRASTRARPSVGLEVLVEQCSDCGRGSPGMWQLVAAEADQPVASTSDDPGDGVDGTSGHRTESGETNVDTPSGDGTERAWNTDCLCNRNTDLWPQHDGPSWAVPHIRSADIRPRLSLTDASEASFRDRPEVEPLRFRPVSTDPSRPVAAADDYR